MFYHCANVQHMISDNGVVLVHICWIRNLELAGYTPTKKIFHFMILIRLSSDAEALLW